jgi:hypothetical protein
MEDRKKQARGLEEVSHFFLSCQSPSDQAKKLTGKQVQADAGEIAPLPDDIARNERLEEAVSRAPLKRSSCLLFSSNRFFAEKSFLACDLALELARRDFSVGLIEATTRLPNTFFFLGSLVPGSTRKESPSSLSVPPAPPAPEPLVLVDISIGGCKKIKAVFWEKGFDSADSFTILNRLNSESDFIVINASPDIFGLREMISHMNPFFIVPTTVRSEELLNSYSLIKQIAQGMSCGEVGLLIMEERFGQKAEAGFRVIAEMAHKFLSYKIRFMGPIPKGADLSRSILTRTPIFLGEENSPISQSIRKLADDLIQEKYIHLKETDNVEDNL